MGSNPERAPGPEEPPSRVSREQEQQLKDIHPRIRQVVKRMTYDSHLADDIAQDVCVTLIRKFRDGEVIDNPMAFAITVAKNDVSSYFTDKRRGQVPSESIYEDFADCTPWPYNDSPMIGIRYLNLLAEVRYVIGDEVEACIWEMTHVWGLKGYEIAKMKGISPASVSRKLKQAEEKAKQVRQSLETE